MPEQNEPIVPKPEAEVKEPSAQPQEDLATLKASLAKLETDYKRAIEEAKSHQASAVRSAQRLKEAEDLRGEIKDLREDIKIVADYISNTRSKVEEDEVEKPKTAPLSLEVERQKRSQAKVAELASKADGLARSVGLDMEDSSELQKALNLFLRGRPDAGLAEVERVVEEKRKATPQTTPAPEKKQLSEQEEEEIARKYLERTKALKTDTGSPSGVSRDWASVKKAYANHDITTAEYEAEAKKRGVSI